MNLYVGNLSEAVVESDLEEAFSAFGEVSSVKIIRDKFTGMSKKFGFVEMADKAQAQEAIEKLNYSELKGYVIVVNEAHPKKPQQKRKRR